MSAGHATSLVRDDGVESIDEPSGKPLVPEDSWQAAVQPEISQAGEGAEHSPGRASVGRWLLYELIFLVVIAAVIFIFLIWINICK